jgi:hypothetical protein
MDSEFADQACRFIFFLGWFVTWNWKVCITY